MTDYTQLSEEQVAALYKQGKVDELWYQFYAGPESVGFENAVYFTEGTCITPDGRYIELQLILSIVLVDWVRQMLLVSGHRLFKLLSYDIDWIKQTLSRCVSEYDIGLSGMASGVDLWFCQALLDKGAGYYSYIPFEGQAATMSEEDAAVREELINKAWAVYNVRNSQMVEDCDKGIIVWDGNKGGTHNVFQQMVEKGKPFVWIEPRHKKVREII